MTKNRCGFVFFLVGLAILASARSGISASRVKALWPAPPQAATTQAITLPSGTSLFVRMIDSVDSSKNKVGDSFHASLQSALVVGNTVVAPKGADVYGKLANAKSAGKISGGAALGAGVGAGAGTTVQLATHGDQIRIPSETLLEFKLEQDVTVPVSSQ
ncbi:MAG TPA: hypothetical protein VMJ93_13180 [Verrucomicrobiae bacterium]|nr:hypothetical protein [Verrucomicrobiae bacterium]